MVKPAPDMERAYRDFTDVWERHGEVIIPYAARLLGRTYTQWLAEGGYITQRYLIDL